MPMRVIRTVKGNHSRSVNNGDKVYVFNQREVDEFKKLLIVKYVIKIKIIYSDACVLDKVFNVFSTFALSLFERFIDAFSACFEDLYSDISLSFKSSYDLSPDCTSL